MIRLLYSLQDYNDKHEGAPRNDVWLSFLFTSITSFGNPVSSDIFTPPLGGKPPPHNWETTPTPPSGPQISVAW